MTTSNGYTDRRRHRRIEMLAVATINVGQIQIPCIITNVSKGGARVRLLEDGDVTREPIVLESQKLGVHPARVVWQNGNFAGLKFAAEMLLADRTVAPQPVETALAA